MKVTTDNITDEQIRALLAALVEYGPSSNADAEICSTALARFRDPRGKESIRAARARCAEIWNARTGSKENL